jgi:hypothetical protein
MASLDRKLRKDLENAVKKARRAAEAGARQVLEQLAVHHHEPWGALAPEQRKLRNRLRAHGRQLGDKLDEKGTQSIDRLAGECAYEHWHRLLFARFLAENDLLVEPDSGMALSLDECRELARERSVDWLVLASEYAQRMLPQIFRTGDPVLDVSLPPEKRQELETILEGLPSDVFVADDSLGWVYQYWQGEQKDTVNKSGEKIGADELPSVTQLFTEDYMVLFLLHNTLGAWWAARVLAARPELARSDTTEVELRRLCALPAVEWDYLRFMKEDDGVWRPAAGTFDGWPRQAKDITVLDPCMGSGHFLVFALPILAAMRMAEEGLSKEATVDSVLRENLFGLEIDPRCTQIAAFNLALAAWRRVGHCTLPAMNLACPGLAPNVREAEWLTAAGNNLALQNGMERLYGLFQDAPVLGSLIDPSAAHGDLLEAGYHQLQPLLDRVLLRETKDDTAREMAVAARGLAKAADILVTKFTLVVTNVPYLKRGKQTEVLCNYCEEHHKSSRMELATVFIDRCQAFARPDGTVAVVSPQSWLFQGGYLEFRKALVRTTEWQCLARLGPGAFATITGEVVNVSLVIINRHHPDDTHNFSGIDVSSSESPSDKASQLVKAPMVRCNQLGQLTNPESRIVIGSLGTHQSLKVVATSATGMQTFDSPRFLLVFWEHPAVRDGWVLGQTTVESAALYSGCHTMVRWEDGRGDLFEMMELKRSEGYTSGIWRAGTQFWGRRGVLVSLMGDLPCSLYLGGPFDNNTAAIVPHKETDLPALWAYCSSAEFKTEVRRIDQSLKVTTNTLEKVPLDIQYWRERSAEMHFDGLSAESSPNPTEWSFTGNVQSSIAPLHVAVARLLGYRWPRQNGSSVPGHPALGADGFESHADADGIVCLSSAKGEVPAVERLREALASVYGQEWSVDKLGDLLAQAGSACKTLDDWIRHEFFGKHCDLFHQRPFIWQIWDGLQQGFSALLNCHMLAAPNGEGRRTLEKLIYSYLGDWIDRQRADQKTGVEGADGRVAAAEHLKRELEKILKGEPPYDIFVRWKPLDEQPVGWDPDINDGVRINIRPFMMAKTLSANGKKQAKGACILRVPPKIKWDKDRGKEPTREKADYPWFWAWDEQSQDFPGGSAFDGNRWNDLHYSRDAKLAARARANGDKT